MKAKNKIISSEKRSVKSISVKRDCIETRDLARVKGVVKKISYCVKRNQLPVSANPGMPKPHKPKKPNHE